MSLIRYIKLDISRLEREQKKEQARINKLNKNVKHNQFRSELLPYLIARKHTLQEILPLVQKEKGLQPK